MRFRFVALVTIAACALPVAGAGASREAKKGELAGIGAAILSEGLSCERYPPGTCELKVAVSSRNKRWAVVRLRATANGETTVNPESISLHSKGQGKRKRWRVISVGNGGGCGVPRRIRRDLHLICLPS